MVKDHKKKKCNSENLYKHCKSFISIHFLPFCSCFENRSIYLDKYYKNAHLDLINYELDLVNV